jgi:hypothetical protein
MLNGEEYEEQLLLRAHFVFRVAVNKADRTGTDYISGWPRRRAGCKYTVGLAATLDRLQYIQCWPSNHARYEYIWVCWPSGHAGWNRLYLGLA